MGVPVIAAIPPAAATVPVRSEASSAPAVTAAVSARSTLSPNPTVGRPERQLVGAPPALGPDGHDALGQRGPVPAQLGQDDLARATQRRQLGERARCRRPRAARRGGTGRPPRGPPGAAARRVACPRARSSAPRCARLRSGTMRSMPSSVSFWTTHSGRSPLTGAKATVSAGSARASNCTAPSPPMPAPRRERLERSPSPRQRGAGPAPAPVGWPRPPRRRAGAAPGRGGARPRRTRTGCAGSSTKTWRRGRRPDRDGGVARAPALAKGRAQAREHALAAPGPGRRHVLAPRARRTGAAARPARR